VFLEWPYGSGLPPPNVKQRMEAFEEGIEELMFDNGFSELVMVRTGLGRRDWLFYTSDQARFMARLNGLLAGHDPYPLRITISGDPDWKAWHETRDEVCSRGVTAREE
jgi:hypothetical protein